MVYALQKSQITNFLSFLREFLSRENEMISVENWNSVKYLFCRWPYVFFFVSSTMERYVTACKTVLHNMNAEIYQTINCLASSSAMIIDRTLINPHFHFVFNYFNISILMSNILLMLRKMQIVNMHVSSHLMFCNDNDITFLYFMLCSILTTNAEYCYFNSFMCIPVYVYLKTSDYILVNIYRNMINVSPASICGIDVG